MDNRSFWDKRYSVAPQLGSGRGSRGYAAIRKNELVRRAIREHKITSIRLDSLLSKEGAKRIGVVASRAKRIECP